MLLNCPECGDKTSDKAIACPHCGFPLKTDTITNVRKYKPKHQRLPNGFGQISEIKGRNLRNPFRVMVTVDKDCFGKPIQAMLKPQAYFKTYNDAYAALIEYHKNPFDLRTVYTVEQLYKEWCNMRENGKKKRKTYPHAWVYCAPLYKISVRAVKAMDVFKILNSTELSEPTMLIVKTLLNQLFDYAVLLGLTDKNHARECRNIDQIHEVKHHISFTDEEMVALWNSVDSVKYVDMVLIQCFMGWRPSELLALTLDSVDLKQNIIIGGSKTEAGINRTVPIHPAIRHLILKKINTAKENGVNWLFVHNTDPSKAMTYHVYHTVFLQVLDQLGLNNSHRLHDCRKQFVTMAKKYKVDEYAIKRIVGHRINDITENIYTTRDVSWLVDEIQKIKTPC